MPLSKDKEKTDNSGKKKVEIQDAVGSILGHDVTEVVPGKFKGPAFRKGHRIHEEDLCHLMRLGKRHVYILDLSKDQVHEDDAVLEIAKALSGPGVTFDPNPSEGKIQLVAAHDGLFKVKVESLVAFNLIPDVMCASIHTHTPVIKGKKLAGTRAIPLVIERNVLNEAVRFARSDFPIFSVIPFQRPKTKLIITGNEIYEGLIEDRFESIVSDKLKQFGITLSESIICPDDENAIADALLRFLEDGTGLVITTGGMSVDPDDVTRVGIRKAGVEKIFYGAAVLPGAMFLLAYKGEVPIVGIPACGLYHQATIFDIILPSLLAGERPGQNELARLAHGGLCLDCPSCRFPACPFGKSV